MVAQQQGEAWGHPSRVIVTAYRAYTLAKKLGRQREARKKIREAFIKTYGDLRGECFCSIWLEWVDEA
jgi:hypothetical protein